MLTMSIRVSRGDAVGTYVVEGEDKSIKITFTRVIREDSADTDLAKPRHVVTFPTQGGDTGVVGATAESAFYSAVHSYNALSWMRSSQDDIAKQLDQLGAFQETD
jgi:hypothetical protein